MHSLIAFLPVSAFRNTKNFLNTRFKKEVVSWREVIAKWWLIALLSNVINIELRVKGVSKDCLNTNLAFFKSYWPHMCFN